MRLSICSENVRESRGVNGNTRKQSRGYQVLDLRRRTAEPFRIFAAQFVEMHLVFLGLQALDLQERILS